MGLYHDCIVFMCGHRWGIKPTDFSGVHFKFYLYHDSAACNDVCLLSSHVKLCMTSSLETAPSPRSISWNFE